jgi:hypothetical protein
MHARMVLSRGTAGLLLTAICAVSALAYVASDFVPRAQAQTTVMNVKRAKAVAIRATGKDCKRQAELYTEFLHRDIRCLGPDVSMCWRQDLYHPNTALCLADFYMEDHLMPDEQWLCSTTHVVDYKGGRYRVRAHPLDDYYCHKLHGIPG